MRFSRLTHMPHQIAQRARNEAARRRPADPQTHDCAACGLVGEGCFGFGGLPSVANALWSCRDADCKRTVAAMAAARDRVGKTSASATSAVPAGRAGDLFGQHPVQTSESERRGVFDDLRRDA